MLLSYLRDNGIVDDLKPYGAISTQAIVSGASYIKAEEGDRFSRLQRADHRGSRTGVVDSAPS